MHDPTPVDIQQVNISTSENQVKNQHIMFIFHSINEGGPRKIVDTVNVSPLIQ